MLLFTPGPTPTPEFIRNALSMPTIHHRTPEFEEIFSDTRLMLKDMLGTKEVLMLASSGSGAMEACLLTFCSKKVLVVNSGKFGERFAKIANSFNIPCVEIKNDWDTPVGLDSVMTALKENPDIDAICMQACESAGGLRQPYEVIAKSVKEFDKNIVVIVDAITAMGVEKLDVSNIDALIGGSQKAFMLPTGMSIIGLSDFAIEKLESRNYGFYFNLKIELKNQQKNTTAWSAPVSLVTGLHAYLKEASKIGFDHIYKDTKARSLACDCAVENLGLRIYPKLPALAMTTVIDVDADSIRKILKKDYDVNIAGGQDILKGKIFRINHMGMIPIHEISWVINAIELCLAKLGKRDFNGLSNQIFLQQYYSIMENQ